MTEVIRFYYNRERAADALLARSMLLPEDARWVASVALEPITDANGIECFACERRCRYAPDQEQLFYAFNYDDGAIFECFLIRPVSTVVAARLAQTLSGPFPVNVGR